MSADDALRLLTGPTASGKTALALEVAERAGAEIVSMDSMLVYRGMDVGTAKPGAAERARVPHHLIDLVEPRERYDVQRWLRDAEEGAAAIRARGRRVLFVGGTALYLQVLVRGLFEGPAWDAALRRDLKARVAAEGLLALHARLAEVDPRSAERIHPNDEKRILRALEVWEQTGRPLSALQSQWGAGPVRTCRLVGLHVEPEALAARIRTRTRRMLAAGWVEEAVAIREGGGFGPTARQALGYREVLAHADGELGADELVDLVTLRTRQFARRQRTWFRRFQEGTWLPADQADAASVLAALGW